MTKEEILKQCTVNGTTVYLPAGELDRKLYLDVAKSLELIGGKWKGGKVMGFIFKEDPTELLAQIANGDKRNLKKEFQYFATPYEVAKDLVRAADIKQGDRILEPSAGQGAIVKAIFELHPFVKQIDYCELMPVNKTVMERIEGTLCIADDFLSLNGEFHNYYDKIIANPPFAKNQDIDHIYKMYECLKPGGKLVSASSKHWMYTDNKKEKTFREWLQEEVEADINSIGAGQFAESGTMIETLMIEITKE